MLTAKSQKEFLEEFNKEVVEPLLADYFFAFMWAGGDISIQYPFPVRFTVSRAFSVFSMILQTKAHNFDLATTFCAWAEQNTGGFPAAVNALAALRPQGACTIQRSGRRRSRAAGRLGKKERRRPLCDSIKSMGSFPCGLVRLTQVEGKGVGLASRVSGYN
jgi:hypothetical protein